MKNKKTNSRMKKVFAISQISILILEIFAFCFIFTMSFGEVSGADTGTVTLPDYSNKNAPVDTPAASPSGPSVNVKPTVTPTFWENTKAFFSSLGSNIKTSTVNLWDKTTSLFSKSKTTTPTKTTATTPTTTPAPITVPQVQPTGQSEDQPTGNDQLPNAGVQTPSSVDKAPTRAPVTGAKVNSASLEFRDKVGAIQDTGKNWKDLSTAQQATLNEAGWDQSLWDENMIKNLNTNSGIKSTPYETGIKGLNINAPSTALGPNGEITAGAWGLSTAGNLVQGLEWAAGTWTLVQVLGSMGIVPEEMSKALGQALFAGIMAGKIVNIGSDLGYYSSGWSVGAGIVTAYLVFASQYKTTETRTATVNFKCMTWQAPIVQDKATRTTECNKCNTDILRPCSEYRCKALGQSCKIINQGLGQEKCIDGAPDDVTSPGIKPWPEILTAGYSYANVKARPAGGKSGTVSGMSIQKNGGCLEAWTPFIFGIRTTDKGEIEQPAQCKIDFNHTASFDAMTYWMGEVNTFMENHSQSIALPGTKAIQTDFPELKNDGEYKLYVRCKDGNGNTNEDEFVVNFCIDKTPDLTPPVIKATSPLSGSPVLYKIDNLSVNVYTNEPSKCKWSRKNGDYATMENNLTCSNNIWQVNAESLYTCTTTLTGIKDKAENKFYFRCIDNSPQKNMMSESYEYTLYGTQPLTILNVGPTGTIGSSTSTANISLTVRTDNGYNNGEATCSYSTSKTGNYQQMFDSGGRNTHSQTLDLVGGTYTYYFKCLDLGGNTVYDQTTFTVYIDKYAPQVLRFYNAEGKLKVLTNEASVCKYSTDSCNFDLNKEGITNMIYDWTNEHWAEWKTDQMYYIKCMDQYNNQPEPSDCSVIIRPYELSKVE